MSMRGSACLHSSNDKLMWRYDYVYSTDPGPRSSSPVAMDTNDVNSRPSAYCKSSVCYLILFVKHFGLQVLFLYLFIVII